MVFDSEAVEYQLLSFSLVHCILFFYDATKVNKVFEIANNANIVR